VPINFTNMHWGSVLVHLEMKTLEIIDSMFAKMDYYRQAIDYIINVLNVKYGKDQWEVRIRPSLQQNNGNDCGYFVMLNAYKIKVLYIYIYIYIQYLNLNLDCK
jgi:Ulp1 family protease